jgi:hypothetical protein
MSSPHELDQVAAPGAMTPEQLAILGSAAKTDSEVAPVLLFDADGNAIAPPAPEVDPAAEAMQRNVQLFQMALMMLKPVAPFLEECYPPETVNQIAGAFTAVELKRGWNVGKFMSEEFVLVVVALPPTIMAYAKGREYIAAQRAQLARPNPETIAANLPGDGQQ